MRVDLTIPGADPVVRIYSIHLVFGNRIPLSHQARGIIRRHYQTVLRHLLNMLPEFPTLLLLSEQHFD